MNIKPTDVRIIDTQDPFSKKWLGAIGLRKLIGQKKKVYTASVARPIDGRLVSMEGEGPSLKDALDDAQKRLREYEESLKNSKRALEISPAIE